MENNLPIGIIAGTRTDTAYGLELIERYGYKGSGIAISESPTEQTRLQVLSKEALTSLVSKRLKEFEKKHIKQAIIYCNSLSGAINLERIRQERKLNVITPLEIYSDLAPQYRVFGVLAANCQSAAGIEKIILKSNPEAIVLGLGNLKIVNDIEENKTPQEMLLNHELIQICRALQTSGAERIILGCTHFPYFAEALRKYIPEIFDPGDALVKKLHN